MSHERTAYLSFLTYFLTQWIMGILSNYLKLSFKNIWGLCSNSFELWKDSITHIHGLAIYVKEGLSIALDLSLEKTCEFLLMYLIGFT